MLPRETDLSAENRMSRQAVREALKVLAAKGLISTRRRAGSVVTSRHHWNIFDPDVVSWHESDAFVGSMAGPLTDLRQIIEPRAAAMAAVNALDADISAIATALSSLEGRKDNLEERAAADAAFHAAIMAASGNTLLARIAVLLSPAIEVSVRLQDEVRPKDESSDTGHAAILNAIEARSPDRAATIMIAHLTASRDEVDRLIARGGYEAAGQEALIADGHYPKTPLHGRLAHDLGRAIVVGTLPPGEFLPREAELAESRGVSRQAVREAFRVLAAKGLVSTRQRSGTSVAERSEWNLLDPDVVEWLGTHRFPGDLLSDLAELREVVEPQAAFMAAERRPPGYSCRDWRCTSVYAEQRPAEPGLCTGRCALSWWYFGRQWEPLSGATGKHAHSASGGYAR